MNEGEYVFSQLIRYLDDNKFFRIVKKYNGDKGSRRGIWLRFCQKFVSLKNPLAAKIHICFPSYLDENKYANFFQNLIDTEFFYRNLR